MGQIYQLPDEEIRKRLLEAYSSQKTSYPETDQVKTLKNELYRRGHRRGEVETVALAALIHERWASLRRAG